MQKRFFKKIKLMKASALVCLEQMAKASMKIYSEKNQYIEYE
jgi:hypothetical protein